MFNFFQKPSFKKKVDEFWDWFKEYETEFKNFANKNKFETIIAELKPQFYQLFGEVQYELNQRNKIILSVSSQGNPYVHLLIKYWQELAPEFLNWEFSRFILPCKDLSNLELVNEEKKHCAKDFLILHEIEENEMFIDLIIFHPDFVSQEKVISEEMAYFWLDQALGEEIMTKFIKDVQIVEEINKKESVNLPYFQKFITDLVAKKPHENEQVIEIQVPEGFKDSPRGDIFLIVSQIPQLYFDFYEKKVPNGSLKKKGAVLKYLFFPMVATKQDLQIKDELYKKLNDILKKEADGEVLGKATGYKNLYVDFILFDEKKGLSLIEGFLSSYENLNYRIENF